MPTYEYIQGVVNRPPRPRSERLRKLGAIVSTSATVGSPAGYYSGEGHSHQNLAALNMITVDDGYIYLTDAVIDPDTQESAIETTKVKAGYADMALTNADGHTLDWFLPVVVDGERTLQLNPVYVGLWANGWMASGGVGNGSSGSSGGVDLDRIWQSLTNNTDKPDIKINLAHIPDLTTSKISNLEGWIAGKGYVTASAIPSTLAQLSDDTTHRLVTDTQIIAWNNKVSNVQADWNATTGLAAILNKPSLSAVATSGSYNDLSNKPSIPTEATVSGWGFTKNAGTVTSVGLTVPTGLSVSGSPVTASGTLAISFAIGYSIPTTAKQSGWDAKYNKPSGGIPKSDLASDVQTSLGKADTALQSFTETDPVYSEWVGASRTRNTVFAAPSSANGVPSFRALVASDIPSLTISKISDAESWITGKGYALNSDLTSLTGRVASIEDWFEVVTVNGQSALHVKQSRALYADSWIASGGVGSGSGGGGTMVVWGTKSGYTRPLTVEGVTETLLLDGALSGYATTSAVNTALSGKQDAISDLATIRSNATNGNTAHGWGNHADAGYLTESSLSAYALKVGGTDYNFKVDSLIVTDGGTLDGTTYNGKPVLRFSYRYTDESSMTPTIVSETKYLAYKDEIPTDYVKTSGAQQVSGVKTFLANVRGGASASVNWQITTAGAATFASLTVGGNAVTPSNYVTLDGPQTITGAKTFSAQMTASGGIVTGNDIRPSANLGASLGNGNYRFSGLSVNTISSSAYYFRDSAWSSIAHYAGGFDDGIGYMCIYLDADPSNQNPPQNPHYYFFGSGSFQGRGGTKNLGSSGVPWGDVYIANNKAIKSPDTGGTIRELLKLANNDWLYIGNNGITSVQLNATGYIKMYWDSGDAYASFGAGANAYFPNLLPNGNPGTKNLGSPSVRWNNIYGVNADLSGNLSLSQNSHIDIGPVRLEYANEALHITTNDATNHPNIGAYADGLVAAGGIGSGNASVKYVTCTQLEYNAMTKDPATLYLIGSPISKVCLGSITLYSEN